MGKPLRSLQRRFGSLRARPNESAVIVLGNHKSGTTAIAALLAEYSGLSATLDFFPYLHADRIIQAFRGPGGVSRLVADFPLEFSRGVVKEPHLTFLYPRLATRFPRARFLMIVRDPRDNIRSILDRLGLPGDRRDLELDARDLPGTWPLVLDGRWLGFHGDGYIDMLAQRWNAAAGLALEHRDGLEVVRYEDFVADKAGFIARTADTLGLPCRNDIGHRVDHAYQRRGNRSVSWERFFGPRNLRRIQERCGPRMTRLGYRA